MNVEEYLHNAFTDLNKEYRDGEILERSQPDYLHGKTQGLLVAFFLALPDRLSLYPCAETRMRIRPGRYLIPDVAVFYPVEPCEVPVAPPLVAIEVLSPDDRMSDVREKLEEYRTWGVSHVWLTDPRSRRFYVYGASLIEQSTLRIPELDIELTDKDIFR